MEEKEYFQRYEESLTDTLVRLCTSARQLDGRMLEVEELYEYWQKIAPEYMADAVSQINSYPAVAIAWAAYIGMAMAKKWDEDWESNAATTYEELKGPDGFDYMDEHLLLTFLGIEPDSPQAHEIEDILRSCAHAAMSMIRHEEIESQSTKAFYILADTVKVMFHIGVSLELRRIGYKYEKVSVNFKNN